MALARPALIALAPEKRPLLSLKRLLHQERRRPAHQLAHGTRPVGDIHHPIQKPVQLVPPLLARRYLGSHNGVTSILPHSGGAQGFLRTPKGCVTPFEFCRNIRTSP